MTDPERLDWMDRNRLILFMALRKAALGKPIREIIDELFREYSAEMSNARDKGV